MTGPPDLPGFTDVVEIGAGAYGTVYRAWQVDFDRAVAIKVLHGVHTSPESLERFTRERRVLGGLSAHPHIVTVHAAGVSASNQPYIVMAFLDGGAWGDRIEADGQLPWAAVLDTGVKLSGALATAHDAGVLHRDIKPDNVLIDVFGEPQLADFGVARLQGGQTLTQEGSAIGTLNYMAPEAVEGEVTPGTDVYSLAATLHHALLGRPAFARDELMATIVAIVNDDVPPLVDAGVPAAVEQAVVGGMARERSARHPDAATFGRALQAAQANLGLPVTPMLVRGVAPLPPDMGTATVGADRLSSPVVARSRGGVDEGGLLDQVAAAGDGRAAAAMTVSRLRSARGDVDGAIGILKEVLVTEGTDHGSVRAGLARLATRANRPQVAAESLAVDDTHPDVAAVRLVLADIDRRLGRTDTAVTAYRALSAGDDPQVTGWAQLKLAHCRRHDDPDAAQREYSRLAGTDGAPAEVRAMAALSHAQVLAEVGRQHEATAALEAIVGQPDNPCAAVALAMLATEQVWRGDLRNAQDRVRVLEEHQSHPDASIWLADAQAVVAAAHRDRLATVEAVARVHAGWANASGAALLVPAAHLLVAVGADHQADDVLRAAHDRKVPGQQADVALALADLHRRRGEHDAAIDLYDAIAAGETTASRRAVLHHAELQIQRGDHDRAGTLLAPVMTAGTVAEEAQARILSGISLLDRGRWGRGRVALDEVAGGRDVRQSVDALLWLIRLHVVRGDAAAATAALAMAEGRAQQDPVLLVDVLRAGAEMFLRTGRPDEAVAKLHEATGLAGRWTADEIAVQHAAVLIDSGQDDAAADRLRRIVADAENDVAVGKAELLLGQLELRAGDTDGAATRLRRLADQDTPVAAAANATIVLQGLGPDA